MIPIRLAQVNNILHGPATNKHLITTLDSHSLCVRRTFRRGMLAEMVVTGSTGTCPRLVQGFKGPTRASAIPAPTASKANREDWNMSNPVVLITGGLSGIGRATAVAFGKDGTRVVASDRREAEGKALEAELGSLGAVLSFAPTCAARTT